MLPPAWYWARAELRRRWTAWLAIALVVGIGGGLATGALAGARRTDSAYPRFLEWADPPDLVLDPNFEADGADFLAAVAALPEVADRTDAQAVAIGRVTDGRIDVGDIGTVVASVDGDRFYERDRVHVTEGRMPDPGRPDEVLVSHTEAAEGVAVGDRIRLAVLGVEDAFGAMEGGGDIPVSAADGRRLVDAEVVGIGIFPEMAVTDEELAPDLVLVTPAMHAELPPDSHLWSRAGIHLAEGVDPGSAQRRIKDIAGDMGGDTMFEDRSDITERAQRAIRPYVLALGGLGAAGAAFVTLLGSQLVRRTVRSADADRRVLVALSARPRLVRVATAMPAALAGVAAVVIATSVQAAVSWWTPVGPVRPVEPDPGPTIDWAVAAPGAAWLFAICAGAAWVSARRPAVAHAGNGSLATWATRAGASLPAVLGIGRATGAGDRARRAAARSGLASVAVATTMVVAVGVFAASLAHVVDNPEVHGWNADVALLGAGGYGNFDLPAIAEVDGVESLSGGIFGNVGIEDTSVPGLGLVQVRGGLLPPITDGRAPSGPGEIALGRASLSEIGASIGDAVDVRLPGDEPMQMTIVGTTVLPGLGPIDNDRPALGNGALLVLPPEMVDGGEMWWSLVLADLAPGADRDAVTDALVSAGGAQAGDTDVFHRFRPADIAAFADVGSVPVALAGLFGLLALASLMHVLLVTARAWRRDRATLAALGATRRQLAQVVRWHSTVVVGLSVLVALPAGAVLGRAAWRSLAVEVGIVPKAVVPVLPTVALVLALLVASAVATTIPERLHARVRPARHLRAE
ncbi:MAG: FtsX-like permease family protein [Acidimicrobiia bacterium]